MTDRLARRAPAPRVPPSTRPMGFRDLIPEILQCVSTQRSFTLVQARKMDGIAPPHVKAT